MPTCPDSLLIPRNGTNISIKQTKLINQPDLYRAGQEVYKSLSPLLLSVQQHFHVRYIFSPSRCVQRQVMVMTRMFYKWILGAICKACRLHGNLRESRFGCLLSGLLCRRLLARLQYRQFDTPSGLRPTRLIGTNCGVASVTSSEWPCDLFL